MSSWLGWDVREGWLAGLALILPESQKVRKMQGSLKIACLCPVVGARKDDDAESESKPSPSGYAQCSVRSAGGSIIRR